ncbi:hypothetical protein WR25_15630 isoform A [Diploscapter pachys]|uniref:Acyl-peptide hydrolase n=2 Tax=Diploscapter pachys TaxID=2018661 RepID=A0A2A2M0I8_9BILA|nr:hypothetical protein WR25_15630 isoform A [Diploscapter pachys]
MTSSQAGKILKDYGSWTSKITTEVFGQANCKDISELQVFGETVFWIEQSSKTGKRELYSLAPLDKEKKRWAPEQSVQNSVHEYGGGSFMPMSDNAVVFTTNDGLFLQKSGNDAPFQLAESEGRKMRFADFSIHGNFIFCVNEDHSKNDHDPENKIVSINIETRKINIISDQTDFCSCPRISPDGKKLVWMQWNHNNMPWDATMICIGNVLEDGTVTDVRKLKDGTVSGVNYHNPAWSSNGDLFLIHDQTNWWNIYEVDIQTGEETNVYPVERDIGYPLWQFGLRTFAVNDKALIMNVDGQLYVRENSVVRRVETPGFSTSVLISLTNGGHCYYVAQGPKRASTLMRIDTNKQNHPIEIIRESVDSATLDKFDISEGQNVEFQSDGVTVSGWFYPPKNSEYSAPDGALPPVLILGHGGPTGRADNFLDLRKQFYTSRGFAVFAVNYRGSTGFGTKFRNMLKKNWGVVDRNDVINAAKALIEKKMVDPSKVIITGSSAGGYLVLAALTNSDIFKSAVSIYGIAELTDLAEESHKFEKGYNNDLIGKYPEEIEIFKERSPINHLDKLNTPCLFMHGTADTVVPMEQSVQMHQKLKEKGLPTGLILFEGEGHGFRGPEAAKKSVEAAYYFICKTLGIEPSIQVDLTIDNLPTSAL